MQTSAAEFVEENLKTIFAYALSRVSNKDDAQDLTNDIVLAILQSADKLKDPNAFYGYVWGIAANTYRKFMRRKLRDSFAELDENLSDGFDFTEQFGGDEDVLRLRREIALLSKEYRECTVAYYYEELPCAEISRKLNISLEMVKYYLFKTRKILKEGISMEREFGEKSFKPDLFEFITIFSGKFNREYGNLFSRKLPGQILMSAYYMPMTPRELAIELGVASVYLEDELELLEKYGLITRTPKGKVQTNLVVFTGEFTEEFDKAAEGFAVPALGQIILEVKEKLAQIRKINAVCERLSDLRLLWGMLWPMMFQGHKRFSERHPEMQERDWLYDGATGTNYGISGEVTDGELETGMFAGYSGIDEHYYSSAADFGVLPEKNRYFPLNRLAVREMIDRAVSGEGEPRILVLNDAEETALLEVLSEEIGQMSALYERLYSCGCRLMRVHAPKSVVGQIDRIVFQTLFFRTVGLIGGFAVRSGELALPDFDGPAAVCIHENSREAEATVNQNVML